jgi:alkanesulfonate monooxygenase SsuD/methylene tetrahydromethanopterin reductase-like flavin-dependent oxidoreductase (luciferase family)
MGRGRSPAHAACLREPQHLRPRRQPRPRLFRRGGEDQDQFGFIEPEKRAIFGRSYADEPDALVKQLAQDEAIAEADTLLLTVPNQLGVDYNAHVIEAILKHVAPALGWR